MRLEAVRFKEEKMSGFYRSHFIVYQIEGKGGRTEVTRFGIEARRKMGKKKLMALVEERLRAVSPNTEERKEFKVIIDGD